jgi:FMN phosphatase YigB (HAD superfamily)
MPPSPAGPVRAVYFDIGETLVDRSREYAAIARSLNVSPNTFSAVLGAMIVRGRGVDAALAHFEVDREAAHAAAAVPIAEVDLYPDARATLQRLHDAGFWLGVVGNQPSGVADELRALDLPVDVIATSAEWGVSKPDPSFFIRIVESAGMNPDEIVYVGDQLDNDVLAPMRVGLRPVRILRGPWGALMRDGTVERLGLAVVNNLTELADLLIP